MEQQKKEENLQAIGTTKEHDEQLAKKGTPLGEAVDANKAKKIEGKNYPST